MRQIKFRAKTTANDHWVYGYYLAIAGTNKILTVNPDSPSGATYYDVDPSTVGQFTRLQDCEGTPVYEGDILSCSGDEDFLPETVIFKDGSFKVKDEYTCVAISEIDMGCRKVIGCAHEGNGE